MRRFETVSYIEYVKPVGIIFIVIEMLAYVHICLNDINLLII